MFAKATIFETDKMAARAGGVIAAAMLALTMLPVGVQGFAIRVDAHEQECFYETTTIGTKVLLLTVQSNVV